MELKIKKNPSINENITILYSISAIMVLFFQINNYKIILEINNFYDKINIDSFFDEIEKEYYILSFVDLLLLFFFFNTGINILSSGNVGIIIPYYILSIYQFIKPLFIFYIYYNSALHYNKKLNISIIFNIFSVILNIISIKLIIRYTFIIPPFAA